MRTKSAQMEIMGIAIITILIVFGFLFFVRFSAFKEQNNNIQKDFQRSSMARYFLDAIQETDVVYNDCKQNVNFQDLATDCAKNNGCPLLGSNPNRNCNICKSMGSAVFDISSCDYLEQRVGDILQNTLGMQGKEYHFFITTPAGADVGVDVISESCVDIPPGGLADQPLSDVKIVMAICSK